MRTAGIKPGDVIDVQIGKQQFWAKVLELPNNEILAEPLVKHVGSARRVHPRSIKGIYEKREDSR